MMADNLPTSDSTPAVESHAAPAPAVKAPALPVASLPTALKPTLPQPAPVKAAPPKLAQVAAPTVKLTGPVSSIPATSVGRIEKKAVPITATAIKVQPVASTPAVSAVAELAKSGAVAAKHSVAAKTPYAPTPIKPAVQAQVKGRAIPAFPATRTKPTPPSFIKPAAVAKPSFFQETFAMTTPTFDFAAAFKTAFSDAQDKAKAAYEKSTVAMGDASEFAKGNVEALVESTKILASGLQELTTAMVAESREAFEALTAEVKTIAGVKSPADFFKLQSELMRKQMDALMANGTKHSEAFLKLASDAAAPLSSRVSLAVEKVKTAA